MPDQPKIIWRAHDLFNLSEEEFAKTGAFDATLVSDAKLYLDPSLLKLTKVSSLIDSHQHVLEYFSRLIDLLKRAKPGNGVIWAGIESQFQFPETKGTGIGYSYAGVEGRGMGLQQAREVLVNIKELVDAGIEDPEIFELMPVFSSGIGCDILSDMIVGIVLDDLVKFTASVSSEFSFSGKTASFHGVEIPVNPNNGQPVILLPADSLKDLPVANSWYEIDLVTQANDELRSRMAGIVGDSARVSKTEQKRRFFQALKTNKKFADEVIKSYQSEPHNAYPLTEDPLNMVKWTKAGQLAKQLIDYTPPSSGELSRDDVYEVALAIAEIIKRLIESGIYNEFLYDSSGKPNGEKAFHNLYLGISRTYCELTDVDVSPHSDKGRGPVDFKYSKGRSQIVITELKLSSNAQLFHGYTVQLNEYLAAEETDQGVFVILKVKETEAYKTMRGEARVQKLLNFISKEQLELKTGRKTVVIDGHHKASASKFHPK